MSSLPARSAIVRAIFTRWNARAESCSCCIADRMSDCPVVSSLQNTHTSAGVISALHTTWKSCDANRARCRSRAASTRAAAIDDASPNRSPVSFSRGAGTRGTSTKQLITAANAPPPATSAHPFARPHKPSRIYRTVTIVTPSGRYLGMLSPCIIRWCDYTLTFLKQSPILVEPDTPALSESFGMGRLLSCLRQ
jgi:hypothetical protein